MWFTNISSRSDRSKLSKLGKVFKESVKSMALKYACVLDPDSDITLTTSDKDRFRYFILGGILGDYPPGKRTKNELTKFLPNTQSRNIGKKQFSTDNAVWVVNEIINNNRNFDDLIFKNKIEIKINGVESVILPYCYPADNKGKPLIPPKIISLLKKKKSF